jgi:two-component system, OmpR family, sensor histidine kinase ChvG
MSVEVHRSGGKLPAAATELAVRPSGRPARTVSTRFRRLMRSVSARFSSSLTRRIVVLNLGGLVALLIGFLYLNQFRQGLIDSRIQSLTAQGEIIALAIGSSATDETSDFINMDPDKLLQPSPGDSAADGWASTQFSINPEKIGKLLRRLVPPTRTRARIYDQDGVPILDSRSLTVPSNLLAAEPLTSGADPPTLIQRSWNEVLHRFSSSDLPRYEENPGGNGKSYSEVAHILNGDEKKQSVVRVNSRGETIVSVALPILRTGLVRGALLLSTQGGDIDKIIASERLAIMRVFLFCAVVMFLVSLFLAGTIAEPVRKLAEAAERVRRGIKSRLEIPDFSYRTDEIGHLSGALRDMTRALYNRIEAIESFAADVSHELKNPLTSLRSAVETLPRVRSEEARDRLLAIIQHDVRRLDRLISDISDASRLDAELARTDMEPVDLETLLAGVAGLANEVKRDDGVRIRLRIVPPQLEQGDDRLSRRAFVISGNESRLGQVVNNLVDNARSFSNPFGEVRVTLRRRRHQGREGVDIIVDDDGPGVPAHAFERIFERFYTDRPAQGFGQNSGLGLSISRQIVEAHGGHIWAENRPTIVTSRTPGAAAPEAAGAEVAGARFTAWLPKPQPPWPV